MGGASALTTVQSLLPSNVFGNVSNFIFDSQNSVIKIVREKYLNTTAFVDKDKLQAFLSELYVFLIDQMHASLNKVITVMLIAS